MTLFYVLISFPRQSKHALFVHSHSPQFNLYMRGDSFIYIWISRKSVRSWNRGIITQINIYIGSNCHVV